MIKSRAKALAVKAMAHQAVSLKHDAGTPIVFDMSDAGTGKTFVRIVSFAERRRKRKTGPLIVLAPRSLLRAAWLADFAKFAPDMKVSVAEAANREKAFAEAADVYVTNHDAVKWLVAQKPAFWKRFEGGQLVIDESTAFKHHTSQRSKAVAKVAKRFERRCVMTATPTSNTILDLWHQVYILDEGQRLGNSFYGFRNAVCEPRQVGRSAHAVRWEDKEGIEQAVYGLIEDITIRHKREDCIDIPATQIYTMPYQLTPKQRKLYDQLEADQILPLLNTSPGAPPVTAVNAAAVITKLLQISSGAVYDGSGKYAVIDTARYEMVMDLVAERPHALVFFFWQHQRDLLVAEAEKRGMTFAVIDGKTADAERMGIVTRYQLGQYDVLFAHPKSAAHGLTLTRGASTIWASPTYDLEWFKQGNQRQARIGQKRKTEVITILAEDTREIEVYDQILMPKDRRMSNLLSLFVQGMQDRALEPA